MNDLPYPRRRDANGWTDELARFLRKKYYRYVCPGWRVGTIRAGEQTFCKCTDCEFDRVYLGVWDLPPRSGWRLMSSSVDVQPGVFPQDGNFWTGRTGMSWHGWLW